MIAGVQEFDANVYELPGDATVTTNVSFALLGQTTNTQTCWDTVLLVSAGPALLQQSHGDTNGIGIAHVCHLST